MESDPRDWHLELSQSQAYAKVRLSEVLSGGNFEESAIQEISLYHLKSSNLSFGYTLQVALQEPLSDEQLIASVFASQGCEVLVTCNSKGGGMIAILSNGAEKIGIQVKDSENAFMVEQILTVTGALVQVSGNTKGFL